MEADYIPPGYYLCDTHSVSIFHAWSAYSKLLKPFKGVKLALKCWTRAERRVIKYRSYRLPKELSRFKLIMLLRMMLKVNVAVVLFGDGLVETNTREHGCIAVPLL